MKLPHEFFSSLTFASQNSVYCTLGDFENIIFLFSVDLSINMKKYNSKSINSSSFILWKTIILYFLPKGEATR